MNDREKRRHGSQRGFTTIEFLVAIGASFTLLAAMMTFERSQLFIFRNQNQQLDLQSTARSVLQIISRDVRRAGLDLTCSGAVKTVAKAKSTEIRVQADLDRSGKIDQANEDVTYRYNSSSKRLERVSGGKTDILVDKIDLSRSKIRFFDATGAELLPGTDELSSGNRDLVQRVRVELAFERPALGSGPDLLTEMATDISLRQRSPLYSTNCA